MRPAVNLLIQTCSNEMARVSCIRFRVPAAQISCSVAAESCNCNSVQAAGMIL
jgi:hypothetical protein